MRALLASLAAAALLAASAPTAAAEHSIGTAAHAAILMPGQGQDDVGCPSSPAVLTVHRQHSLRPLRAHHGRYTTWWKLDGRKVWYDGFQLQNGTRHMVVAEWECA